MIVTYPHGSCEQGDNIALKAWISGSHYRACFVTAKTMEIIGIGQFWPIGGGNRSEPTQRHLIVGLLNSRITINYRTRILG
jgi:hypothetical protein